MPVKLTWPKNCSNKARISNDADEAVANGLKARMRPACWSRYVPVVGGLIFFL